MKAFPLALIALLALLLASCSPPQEPKDILNKLLEPKLANGTWQELPSVVTTTLGYEGPNGEYLEGKYQVMNNHLVIRIFEVADEMGQYHAAVYSQDEAKVQWNPLFTGEVVPGRLDTIIDLNGDQVPELIVDEYKGNNDWNESVQALYAKLVDGNGYERIDTLSHRWFGGSAFNNGGAEYTYKTEENRTKIIVHTRRAEPGDNGPKETDGEYTLRWEPPHLVRENGGPRPPEDLSLLAEAQANLDELNNPERKNGLLTIKYASDNEWGGESNQFYFDGTLSNLKFRDYQNSSESGSHNIQRLEFNNNAVVRATKRYGDDELSTAFLTYIKDEQKNIFTLRRVFASGEEAPTTGTPGNDIKVDDIYYTFDPNESDYIAFIRTNAALFTPGKTYVYRFFNSEGEHYVSYEVDSVLWVREFLNK